MNSSDEADEIRRHMREIREEVSQDVNVLVHKVRNLTNWRYHWQKHPWLCLGTVAALGFLAVPRRLRIVTPDPAALAALAKQRRLVVEEQPQPRKSEKLAAMVLGMASRAMLQGTMNYLQKNGPRLLQDFWPKRKSTD